MTVPLWPAHEETWRPPGRFRFLGVEHDLGQFQHWQVPGSRLWSYHLHYLDAVRQEGLRVEERARLLDDWVRGNPPVATPGWEPYPTALRLVNALGFLAASDRQPDPVLLESLALQAWWLEGTLEWDVGANHLWKDALALLLGREAFSRGRPRVRWRRRGDRPRAAGAARQVLEDGFHVERHAHLPRAAGRRPAAAGCAPRRRSTEVRSRSR